MVNHERQMLLIHFPISLLLQQLGHCNLMYQVLAPTSGQCTQCKYRTVSHHLCRQNSHNPMSDVETKSISQGYCLASSAQISSVAFSKIGSKECHLPLASGGLKACGDVDWLKVMDMEDSFILFHLH